MSSGDSSVDPWTQLSCAQKGCEARGTHVVVQASDMALLFESGAGVLCDECAEQYSHIGGVPMHLKAFAEAVTSS